jgi:hypothetical protein
MTGIAHLHTRHAFAYGCDFTGIFQPGNEFALWGRTIQSPDSEHICEVETDRFDGYGYFSGARGWEFFLRDLQVFDVARFDAVDVTLHKVGFVRMVLLQLLQDLPGLGVTRIFFQYP